MNPIHNLKTILFTLFTLLLLSLMGCGNHSHTHQQLLHAEDIMEEHPDSAYAIVSSLKIDSTTPEEDRALHALLLTQSIDKTDRLNYDNMALKSKADSMTLIAVDYFNKHDRNDRLMKALFYRGVVILLDKDSFTNALHPLYESLELAKENDKPFWIAKNYEAIGDVCFFSEAYRDQMEMQKRLLTILNNTVTKNL